MPNDVDIPQEDGSRADMAASFDRVTASETPIGAPAAPVETSAPAAASEAAPSTESTQESRARDELGRFKPGAAAKGNEAPRPTSSGAQAGAASGAPTGPAAPPAAVAAPVVPPAPVSEPTLKAPSSFKPAAREDFAKAPRAVQEEIIRIDREVRRTMEESAKAREGWQSFQQTVGPYEAMFRQAGAKPEQYVGDLLRTVHALSYSPPHQQADVLADIVLRFGAHLLKADGTNPDGSASAPLDRALVARMQGQPAQQQQAAPQFDKEALLQEAEQRAEDRVRARLAEAELVKVTPELEYLDDMKDDMAALFTAGLATNYKEAYDLALQLPKNASTLAIVRQKDAAKSAANAQASTQRAVAAASSVQSKPGGVGQAQPVGDDTRSHVEAAWDRAAARG